MTTSSTPAVPFVKSPCIKVCVIHPQTELCVGCFRSREELGRWKGMDPDQKRSLIAKLPERARAHAAETARPSRLRDKRREARSAKVLAEEAIVAKQNRLKPQ